MKNIICLISILLLVAVNSDAQTVVVVKKKTAACDTATNEIGVRTTGGTGSAGSSAEALFCNLLPADCTGPLNTAAILHYGTESENVKVAIYADDGDSVPDVGDTLVAVSGVIAGSEDETWYYSAMTTSPNVTNAANYWICRIRQSTWGYYYAAGSTLYNLGCTGCYASPPANLDGEWDTDADRKSSMFVTIGPTP